MSERIILRTAEALVEGDENHLAAEPEVVIGELDGPVGHGLANVHYSARNPKPAR